MFIENVNVEDLGRIIAQLVRHGLTFKTWERVQGSWTIELTGGY